jgi:hypothetical protein
VLWFSLHAFLRPAEAFSTFRLLGGRVHREINGNALRQFGFAPPALEQIGNGSDAQEQPGSPNFMRPECHALNNQAKSTFSFIQSNLSQAIGDADECDRKGEACKQTLQALGRTFHAVQDFYSHSNYLELLLSEDKPLEIVDWSNPPERLSTCYYYYEGLLQQEALETRPQVVQSLSRRHPALVFHSEQEFGTRSLFNCPESTVLSYAVARVSLCYLELNKDNARTLEGSVVSTRYRLTYHQLAKDLAVKDTVRAWQIFEKGVRKKYGVRADSILLSLKLGKPSKDDVSRAAHQHSPENQSLD